MDKEYAKHLMGIYKDKVLHERMKRRLEYFERVFKRDNDKRLFAELAFCICTPQTKARSGAAAIIDLYNNNLLFNGSAEKVANILIKHVRFHNMKAENIVLARKLYFPNEKFVLKDVNFQVKPGETIALVGPTGAGKTTIVNLISRFYEVTKGNIFLDGYSLKKVSLHSLRKQMGIMTQDNFLFSGTIKENIRYGRLDATEEEIIAAAKAVHAHEFIMELEHGYDTEISERGSQLSIGQRQLLAFARTMVSDPRILILDEATSSIDTHTERLVQQGIESLLKGRTSFVIAHRLSTIRKADRIFVIDQGNIMESGNHEELMAKKGAYYQLYESQFL